MHMCCVYRITWAIEIKLFNKCFYSHMSIPIHPNKLKSATFMSDSNINMLILLNRMKTGLQHNTHRALSVNPDGGVIWVLSCDMEKSHGQLEILNSPLSFGLAVMFPTQSGLRWRVSLLCLLTLIHIRAHTFTQTQQHAVTQDLSAFLSVTWQTYRVWLEEPNEADENTNLTV